MNKKPGRSVRTVSGDISPDMMGITYSHEHIVIEESFATLANPLFILNDIDRICLEIDAFHKQGGRTMVDTMPSDCGRDVLKLAEVSRRTGVNIIAPTGIHLEVYYPPNHWRYHYTEDQITRLFIEDITTGIDRFDYNGPYVDRTMHKAGVIKLATGENPITRHQEKIFSAAVNAHLATGAPIITHTHAGRHAVAQAGLLERLGADLSHVVISHADKSKNVDENRALLETGVRVVYESAFRWKDQENHTYRILQALLPLFPDQVTVGMDMAKSSYWKSYGGNPGLTYLLTTFLNDLKKMELDGYFDNIFIKNPATVFCFTE
jgi:5-phospho-D-xylono-1,4-lactonase